MQQWEYCSLILVLNNGGLYGYQHAIDSNISFPIPADVLIDISYANTLRRWNAALGQQGWELVNILTGDGQQEWVYKRPIQTSYS